MPVRRDGRLLEYSRELRPRDDVYGFAEASPYQLLGIRRRAVLAFAPERLFAVLVQHILGDGSIYARPIRRPGNDHGAAVALLDLQVVLKRVDRPDLMAQVKPVKFSVQRAFHNRAAINQVLREDHDAER